MKPENDARHRRQREAIDEAIERRARAWQQAQRIEAYLPTLRRQRQELDDLIRDEEQAVAEIRAAIK